MIYTSFLRHVFSGGGFFVACLCSDCFVLSWDKPGYFEGPCAYVQNIGRSLRLRNAVETIVHPVLWFLQISLCWSWLWSWVSCFQLLSTLTSTIIIRLSFSIHTVSWCRSSLDRVKLALNQGCKCYWWLLIIWENDKRFAGLVVHFEAAVWISGLLPCAGWVLWTLESQASRWKGNKFKFYIFTYIKYVLGMFSSGSSVTKVSFWVVCSVSLSLFNSLRIKWLYSHEKKLDLSDKPLVHRHDDSMVWSSVSLLPMIICTTLLDVFVSGVEIGAQTVWNCILCVACLD